MTHLPLGGAPWQVTDPDVDLGSLAVSETLFSLSNGYMGIRGTLDEVEPHSARGTFLAGVYESHPLSYPEGGYGHPEEGQAMIAVADATPLRLVVDGTPVDVRTMEPITHRRCLDLRSGVLERALEWRTAAGTTMRLRSQRLASLRERCLGAVRFEIRALDGPAHVIVRSELPLASPPEISNDDPRVAEALDQPFTDQVVTVAENGGALTCRTRRTRIRIGAAVHHRVSGASELTAHAPTDDQMATTATSVLRSGQSMVVDKVFAQVWSRDATAESSLEAARAALASGVDHGWDGLVTTQRAVLDEFWEVADVEVDGDPELQQALRFSMFALFTSTACVTGAPVGAKGLTGAGYAPAPTGRRIEQRASSHLASHSSTTNVRYRRIRLDREIPAPPGDDAAPWRATHAPLRLRGRATPECAQGAGAG